MSVFGDILKKFKQEKIKISVDENVAKSFSKAFDFEKISQEKLEEIYKSEQFSQAENKTSTVVDLSNVYWIFAEQKKKDEQGRTKDLNVIAIPISLSFQDGVAEDVLTNRRFALEDVTKGDGLYNTRQEGKDIVLFSAKTQNGYRNLRLLQSGEFYNLENMEPIDSYNPGSPSLLKLMQNACDGADLSKILNITLAGATLKQKSYVSKSDVVKMNTKLEETYKQQRFVQIEKEENIRAGFALV